jgi:RHS repeat-associated protein
MLTQTRISDSRLTSYTWDFHNRLTEELIKTSAGVTVQDDKFTYDIENRRIGKNTLSGGQSWTAYVDANPFMDFNSGGTLLYRYLYGNAIDFLIGRIDTSSNAMWYLTDKLGSVRENTDGSGNVLDSITYDTFGNIIAETHSTSGDRFKYTSREWDSEIGQYFYRARYYSPSDGRFESEDPSGFSAGDTNLYRYTKNAPTVGSDPTGQSSLLFFGKPKFHLSTIAANRVGPDNLPCGAASVQVQFQISPASPKGGKGGAVIQEIYWTGVTYNAQGNPNVSYYMHYWEEFPVKAGGTVAILPDQWNLVSYGVNTYGWYLLYGMAYYYDGISEDDLKQAGFIPRPALPTGGTPVSLSPPPGNWRVGSNGVWRLFAGVWNCLNGVERNTASWYGEW